MDLCFSLFSFSVSHSIFLTITLRLSISLCLVTSLWVSLSLWARLFSLFIYLSMLAISLCLLFSLYLYISLCLPFLYVYLTLCACLFSMFILLSVFVSPYCLALTIYQSAIFIYLSFSTFPHFFFLFYFGLFLHAVKLQTNFSIQRSLSSVLSFQFFSSWLSDDDSNLRLKIGSNRKYRKSLVNIVK